MHLASHSPTPRALLGARSYADVDADVSDAEGNAASQDWDAGESDHQDEEESQAPLARPATLAPSLDDAALAVLIERITRQDERALQVLYDATSARVHGLALRITQRRALAEEVVEDTFWQVWRQAARFDPGRGRPMTWLLSMARSRAIDAVRRDQRFAHDELPDDDAPLAGASAAVPSQDLLDATRGAARVQAALAGLDPRARQLVSLAFFRGLTHEEIAAQEGVPLGSVKSIIRRALQQLRRTLEAEHEAS